MKFVKNKLASIRERVTKGFKYAIRKQLQLALRFISSFLLMAIILFFFHPRPVQYSITPSFKIIDGEYKTTLWKYNYYQTICSQQRTQIGAFWTQQCILSSHSLPEMKSNHITVTLQQLQPQSIHTARLCRHIQSINKSICQERFVEHEEVEIVEIDLEDVVFLSVALRLKDGRSSYFTNPTIVVHTNPRIIVLLIHRFYLIFAGIMAALFALIVSLCLIVKDIYYYTERSEDNNEAKNKDIINKKK